MTMLAENDPAPEDSLPDPQEVKHLLGLYGILHLFKGAERFRVSAFSYTPEDAGIDLIKMFRAAGRRHVNLQATADIADQVEAWLISGDFDANAMSKAYARAVVDFEEVQRVLDQALEAEILAPDLGNEPLPLTAMRFAPHVAKLMLHWAEFGWLCHDGLRDDMAAKAAHIHAIAETLQSAPSTRSTMCRTFPYHETMP